MCPDTATCCLIGATIYGCCPMIDAVCCDDRTHCCPPNTKCDMVHRRCLRVLIFVFETVKIRLFICSFSVPIIKGIALYNTLTFPLW